MDAASGIAEGGMNRGSTEKGEASNMSEVRTGNDLDRRRALFLVLLCMRRMEARFSCLARCIEGGTDMRPIDAVRLDKLCEFLADTLHAPAPCFNNEKICPHMDFGYCRLPDAPDVKECWKLVLSKWMEG